MSDALTLITSAIKTVQKLREIAQKVKDADTMNLIADLNISLADLKMRFAELEEDNLGLRSEIKKGQEQIDVREKLVLRDQVYYFKEQYKSMPVGPYCTRCFDVDGRLVIVKELPKVFHDAARFNCHNCKSTF